MLPTFPYIAMTITGILHVLLGLTILINALVGLNMKVEILTYEWQGIHPDGYETLQRLVRVYLGVVTGSALWIIMVGILGILTGIKSMEHQRTHSLKIGYMVTAILSATIFSLVGISLSAVVNRQLTSIGLVGSICSFADFVLAIVSSSICCCCANPTVTGVVMVQSQGRENFPPPYPVSIQTYPIHQVPDEGFTNPGYQLNAPSVNYTTKNEVA